MPLDYSEMRPEFTMTVDLPHPLIVVDGWQCAEVKLHNPKTHLTLYTVLQKKVSHQTHMWW